MKINKLDCCFETASFLCCSGWFGRDSILRSRENWIILRPVLFRSRLEGSRDLFDLSLTKSGFCASRVFVLRFPELWLSHFSVPHLIKMPLNRFPFKWINQKHFSDRFIEISTFVWKSSSGHRVFESLLMLWTSAVTHKIGVIGWFLDHNPKIRKLDTSTVSVKKDCWLSTTRCYFLLQTYFSILAAVLLKFETNAWELT